MQGNPLFKRLFGKLSGDGTFPVDDLVDRPISDYALGGGDSTVQPLNTGSLDELRRILPKGQTRAGEYIPNDAPQNQMNGDEPFNYGFGRTVEDDPAANTADLPATPVAPVNQKPQSESARLLGEINAAKQQPAQRESGFWNRLGSGLWNGFLRWGETGGAGGLAGLAGSMGAGGIGFGASPEMHGEFKKQQGINRLWNQYGQAVKAEDAQSDLLSKQISRENTIEDNQRARDEFRQKQEYLRSEQNRKISDRESREKTARMTQVAGMFKNLPEYDPADPKYQEMTAALKDVNLPLTPKDAKKKVDLKQDQRTGAWTLILTNPLDGKQEVRPVLDKDGKQLATTPTVVMQGEYGMLRQNDQQAFTAEENDKNRKERLRKWAVENKVTRAKFDADLKAKVAAGTLSQAQADAMLADFPTDLQ